MVSPDEPRLVPSFAIPQVFNPAGILPLAIRLSRVLTMGSEMPPPKPRNNPLWLRWVTASV